MRIGSRNVLISTAEAVVQRATAKRFSSTTFIALYKTSRGPFGTIPRLSDVFSRTIVG